MNGLWITFLSVKNTNYFKLNNKQRQQDENNPTDVKFITNTDDLLNVINLLYPNKQNLSIAKIASLATEGVRVAPPSAKLCTTNWDQYIKGRTCQTKETGYYRVGRWNT